VMGPWDKWLQARGSQPAVPALRKFKRDLNELVPQLARCRGTHGAERPAELSKLQEKLHDLDERVQDLRLVVRQTSSFLQPQITSVEHAPILSEFSGAAADRPVEAVRDDQSDRPVEAVRHDEYGRPQMPAENVAGLGRSLFTDYLLAVELAGTLLLVATVGAIAIAMRRHGPNDEPTTQG